MNLKSSLGLAFLTASLLVAVPVSAQSDHSTGSAKPAAAAQPGQLIRVTEKDAAWAAQERATYPLEVCVASGEALGSMGKSPQYIYRVEGQPDRLVVLCCSGCDEDFLQDPAKHLAKLDAAKAKGTKAAPDA